MKTGTEKGENERRVDEHYEALLKKYGNDPLAEHEIWTQWQVAWQCARLKDREAKEKKDREAKAKEG
jgi:hypothetical protein